MEIVRCPTCRAELAFTEAMIGKRIRCAGCQTIFAPELPRAEAPESRRQPRATDYDDEEDRPVRRRSRRDDFDGGDDDLDDRPRRRRSTRDEDDDDEYEDRRRPKRRKKKKTKPGQPGLAVAAAILFLIWGGLGCLFTLWSIIGLVRLLDLGAPFSFVVESLISTIIGGVCSAYVLISGLKVLNGNVDDIASVGTAVLAICGASVIWSIVRVAMIAPAFMFSVALTGGLIILLFLSGVIVGGIFCIVCSSKYEKWQRSG